MGLEKKPHALIQSYIGHGEENLVGSSIGLENSHRVQEAMQIFKKHYSENLLETTAPYQGAYRVLSHLRKTKQLALATNKPLYYTKPILEELEMNGYFDLVIGGDSVEKKKPHPEMLEKILFDLKIDKNEAILIGDSLADVGSAKAAGIKVCAVTYGFCEKEKLIHAKPDYILDDINELISLLT